MIERMLVTTRKFLLVNVLLLMVLAIPVVLTAQETSDPDDIEEVREELEDINEELALLQRERNTLHQAESLALDELGSLDRQISSIANSLEDTTLALERKRTQVDMLNASNEHARADLEDARQRFADRLVEWYKEGAGSMLGSIVNTGDLSSFFLVASYMEAIMENDQGIIDFIRDQQGR
ncbi:hypothetical protein KAU08_09645, partial [bacterium]|nr:hypothetical protein [bacterium]